MMNLSNKNRMGRAALTAALALLFAGSGAASVAAACGVAVPVLRLYALAALGAALCAAGSCAGRGGIVSLVLFSAAGAALALFNLPALRAVPGQFAQWGGAGADWARAALGGRTLMLGGAFILAGMFYALLNHREFVSLALLILLSMLVACHAMSEAASIDAALPGLIAAAAAFALTGGLQRDASALRVLLPALLAVLVAASLAPTDRPTWRPMEQAAERVRSMFDQYLNFTRERVAFSINEEGYDHGGEVDGQVVAMLGGPAEPHTEPQLRVTGQGEALLRGAIRSAYTGYSWIDATPKSRYLYYDITHRSIRDRVFDQILDSPGPAFRAGTFQVELLDEGTSTLFVPGRLSDFRMDLSTAVYYNTAGEVFMAREVQAGDSYALDAFIPVEGEALRQAVLAAEDVDDDRYAGMLADYTALPAGIEEGVYALTMQVTADARTAYDRAEAIAGYLRGSMRYRLDVPYPPSDRDFVSYFLLDSREGYCSYFATAMAVMGRIAGLPTRYVEGYLARPGEAGEAVLTGEDAHAWAEIYFNGVGWIPFDATAGASGRGDGAAGNGDDTEDYRQEAGELPPNMEGGLDGPGPTPTVPPDDGASSDQPEEEPGDAPEDEPDEPPEEEPENPPEDEPPAPEPRADGRSGAPWLWALVLPLILLIALAALWTRRRLRLSDPERLCRGTRSAKEASMILFRANLTLLAHMGHIPAGAQTPEAFARRMAEQFGAPEYADFVSAVAASRYGGKPLSAGDIQNGLRAYAIFRRSLSRGERLRFTATRVLRGLGDFEQIP